MRRREATLALLALGAANALAQPAKARVRRIGLLSAGAPASSAQLLEGFREGLREHGWVEGRNIALELRWAEGNLERLPALAAEVVRLKPDIIVTAANVTHLAVRKETATIPIVMATGADPVAAGLAASFARPGGNVTGLSGFYDELPDKLLEFAAVLMPRAARVSVLVDANVPFLRGEARRRLEARAESVGLRAEFVEVRTPQDLAAVLAASGRPASAALILLSSPMFFALRTSVMERATARKVAVISVFEEITELGGLMSYAVSLRDSYRRAAYYVDRILRGAAPGELPIEQPTRLSLAVNLKTAKGLGIRVPQELLGRADRVIE